MNTHIVKSFPVEEEYKKPNGISPEDVAELRQWLQTQPHLPNEHITDLDLILSFHSCKRCLESTKKLLDTHYTMKTQFTTIFKDRLVNDNIELVLNRILIKPLPTRTKDGDAILYGRFLDTDPKNYMSVEGIRAATMILELWQREEGTWPGLVIIFDLEGLKFGHIFKVDMEATRQFLVFLEEAIFVNIKGFHLLNSPYFIDYFIAIVKRFVKSDLLEIFRIHMKGSKILEKYLDIAALPKECGGSYKSFEECKEETLSKIKSNKEFFIMENKKRVDESLRPTEIPTSGTQKTPK